MKINIHALEDSLGVIVSSEPGDKLMQIVEENLKESGVWNNLDQEYWKMSGFMVALTVLHVNTHVKNERYSSFTPQFGLTFITFPCITGTVHYTIRLDSCGQEFYTTSPVRAISEQHRDILVAILDSTITVDKDDFRKISDGQDATVLTIWKLLVKEWNAANAEITGHSIPEMHRPIYESIVTDEEYRMT